MSVRFDSTADRISRTTNIPSTANFTMAGWIRIFAAPGSDASIFCIDNGTNFKRLEIQSGTSNIVYFSGGNNTQAIALKLNQWYYVACADDATRGYMYIIDPSTPGVGMFQCASTGPDVPTAVSIGGDQEGETASFDIYKPRIWDGVVLTADQLVAESGSPSPVHTGNLNSSFDYEVFGDILTDTSGNGRDMTNPGGAGSWTTQTSPVLGKVVTVNVATLTMSVPTPRVTGGTVASTTTIGLFDAELVSTEIFDVGTGSAPARYDPDMAQASASGAALAGATSGAATVTGALTTGIALAGAVSAGATVTGALTTAIRPAGSVQGIATVTGALTTGIALAGSSVGVATATGALTTSIALAGATSGQGTATGVLTTAIPLAGATSGQATVTGSLATPGAALAGAISAGATVTGALTTGIALAGAVQGTASSSGSLTTAIRMAGNVAAGATVTGALTTAIPLAGNVAGSSTVTASLLTAIALAGNTQGTSVPQGSLTTAIALAGGVLGVATVSGVIELAVTPLSGDVRGFSVVTGVLGGPRKPALVTSHLVRRAVASSVVRDQTSTTVVRHAARTKRTL